MYWIAGFKVQVLNYHSDLTLEKVGSSACSFAEGFKWNPIPHRSETEGNHWFRKGLKYEAWERSMLLSVSYVYFIHSEDGLFIRMGMWLTSVGGWRVCSNLYAVWEGPITDLESTSPWQGFVHSLVATGYSSRWFSTSPTIDDWLARLGPSHRCAWLTRIYWLGQDWNGLVYYIYLDPFKYHPFVVFACNESGVWVTCW